MKPSLAEHDVAIHRLHREFVPVADDDGCGKRR
jgi:hypothetical protein